MIGRRIKIAMLVLASLSLLAVGAACGAGKAAPTPSNNSATSSAQPATNQRVRPTFLKPNIAGDTVSINLAEVQKDIMAHFKVPAGNGQETFMAYELGGKQYVRAAICPPCGSQSFSLVGATLVCDACGTVFDAKSGAGIRGACVAYPKAPVSFQSQDGTLTMKKADLLTAFQNTQSGKGLQN